MSLKHMTLLDNFLEGATCQSEVEGPSWEIGNFLTYLILLSPQCCGPTVIVVGMRLLSPRYHYEGIILVSWPQGLFEPVSRHAVWLITTISLEMFPWLQLKKLL